MLAYTSGGFTDKVVQKCENDLDTLRQQFRESDLANRIISAIQVVTSLIPSPSGASVPVQDNNLVKQAYGEEVGDVIRGTFVPEGHLVRHHRQKLALAGNSTAPDEGLTVTVDVAEDLRQRTVWMLAKSNSSRNSSVSSPGTVGAQEISTSRRNSIYDMQLDSPGRAQEKSRVEYLEEVLRGSSEGSHDPQKLVDLDLVQPSLDFLP